MADKWEYMVKHPFGSICTHPDKERRANGETAEGNIEEYFNNLGEQGWELCGIGYNSYDCYYYFKRKVIELHEEEVE